MIASDGDWRLEIPTLDHVVDSFTHLSTLAITKPANPRGQSLKLNAITCEPQPTVQRSIVWKKFECQVVGLPNIIRISRECYPEKRSLAFTEERTNVFRYKSRNLKCVETTGIECLLTYVVAIVEGDGTAAFQREHRFDMPGHRLFRLLNIRLRIGMSEFCSLFQGQSRRHVSIQWIVGAGLVRHHVDFDSAPHDLGKHFCAVTDEANRNRALLFACVFTNIDRFVERHCEAITVARAHSPFDAGRIDIYTEKDSIIQRRRQRLCATHSAHT